MRWKSTSKKKDANPCSSLASSNFITFIATCAICHLATYVTPNEPDPITLMGLGHSQSQNLSAAVGQDARERFRTTPHSSVIETTPTLCEWTCWTQSASSAGQLFPSDTHGAVLPQLGDASRTWCNSVIHRVVADTQLWHTARDRPNLPLAADAAATCASPVTSPEVASPAGASPEDAPPEVTPT